MGNVQDRQQLSTEELKEFPMVGPFGGIQSELPLSLIEDYGFADCQNICFRLGEAQHRPTYTILPALPGLLFGEYVTTFATFYDSLGLEQQVVITNLPRILRWNGAWTVLTGPSLATGSPNMPFATAVLKQKLCFSSGGPTNTVQVMLYDPQLSAGTYVLSSANAQEPLNLAEINLHLMTSNVLIIGTGLAAQRYQWSGSGDPTDWTSFNAGVNDEWVDLGPSIGLLKLGQYGFGFHPKGILQIIPTGNGVAPFAFVPMANGVIGPRVLFGLQKVVLGGVDCAVYPGPDNVYLFNQTSLEAIGDAPIGQRRRLGARSRIMADIAISGQFGGTRSWVTQAPGGVPFLAYYLLCIKNPNDATQCPLWVYNFDEANWTRWIFNKIPQAIGDFVLVPGAIGPVDHQVGISFKDGTVGYFDFNQAGSETSSIITSGKLIMGDRRHKKTVQKFRLAFTDKGPVTFTLNVTNESGVSDSDSITLGTGSGENLSAVLSVRVTGLRLQYTLSAPGNSKFGVIELTPMYDTGGEQRGGTADGN